MKEHREKLLGLIKMMGTIREESFEKYRPKDDCSPMTEHEASIYINIETLISIRELTRMFIDELNTEYLQCSEGDEIVRFIEEMIEWLQSAYDFIITGDAYGSGVKELKICNQALNDYKKVYSEAKESKIVKGNGNVIATIDNVRGLEFGKRNLPKEQYNSNTVQPITLNITFTGDSKENELTAEKLENMINKIIKKQPTKYGDAK